MNFTIYWKYDGACLIFTAHDEKLATHDVCVSVIEKNIWFDISGDINI